MKNYIAVILLVLFNNVYAQKNFSLGVGGDFSFATNGLGTNDAAFGFHVQGNLFAKRNLQLHIQTGADYFVGNKLLELDVNGNLVNTNPAIKRFIAGPEYFWNETISTGALYGAVWNNANENNTVEDGFKVFVASYFGKRKGKFLSFSFTTLPGSSVSYCTLGLGFVVYR